MYVILHTVSIGNIDILCSVHRVLFFTTKTTKKTAETRRFFVAYRNVVLILQRESFEHGVLRVSLEKAAKQF